MGDNEFSCLGNKVPHSLSDKSVSLGIHRACGVVHNKYFRFFQQCPRDTQTLLLTAGNVGSPLLDVGVVSVGEAGYKLVRLRKLAGFYHFLIGSLLVAPTEVFFYGTRKKNIFLKYHRYLISKSL